MQQDTGMFFTLSFYEPKVDAHEYTKLLNIKNNKINSFCVKKYKIMLNLKKVFKLSPRLSLRMNSFGSKLVNNLAYIKDVPLDPNP
jgi:hypothetical protein